MKESTKNAIKGEIILLIAAILWGSCFIFQKKGMDYIGPFTLGAFRFLIGGIILIPVIMLIARLDKKKPDNIERFSQKNLWIGSLLCGTALFIAASLQQIGLIYTTAGKAAFLTAMEIVAVEMIGFLLVRKFRLNILLGISLAVLGMYLLCIKNGVSMEYGDILELVGALFWGFQILLIDKYSRLADSIKLSCLQFMVAGVLSVISMFLFEKPRLTDIYACVEPILYTAIIEVAICYTLQIIGQKYVPPVIAAVTLSLESVFAAIFGAIILNEILTGREISGMVFMLLAVIVIQIPIKKIFRFFSKSAFFSE